MKLPKIVNIPPIDAPKTSAGENTPPKKPKLKQITVTKSLRVSITIKNPSENELPNISTIVFPPNPRISGKNPPKKTQITTAIKILESSVFPTKFTFLCKERSDLIKITAPAAQIGPSTRDKDTEGSRSILASVF